MKKYEFNQVSFEELRMVLSKEYLSTQNNDEDIRLIFRTIDVDLFSRLSYFFERKSPMIIRLTFVHECSNTITEKDCEILSEYLQKMDNLKELQLFLRLNKINDGIVSIAEVLPRLSYLERLMMRMQSNGITNIGLKSISIALNLIPSLQDVELMLHGNEITDLSNLQVHSLVNLSKFHLQITKNPIHLEQVVQLVQDLHSYCPKLKSLNLDIQDLKSSRTDTLPNLLNSLTDISQLNSLSLDLENSKVSLEQVDIFTKRLTQMKELRRLQLNLKNNQLRDAGCSLLKTMLLQMPNLTSLGLILDVNQISTIGIDDLISGISSLKWINQLSFSIMANQSDRINSIYSEILTKIRYLSQVQIHASGRFKLISEEFANYYSQIYVMIIQMSAFEKMYSEFQLFNPCFIMQDLFYD